MFCPNNQRGLLEWDGLHLKAHCEVDVYNLSAMAAAGTKVYLAGWKIKVLDENTGSETLPLPDDRHGSISAMAVGEDGKLYVAWFGSAFVSAWDGSKWERLGHGPEGTRVNVLLPTGLGLFAGGEFAWARVRTRPELGYISRGAYAGPELSHKQAGIACLNNVGRWNGSEWLPLGEGIQAFEHEDALVFAMDYTNGVLYVGGRFQYAGGRPASNIAAWDGQRWFPLGEGVTGPSGKSGGTVYALAIHGDHLYVGGEFAMAGGKPAVNFARWRFR